MLKVYFYFFLIWLSLLPAEVNAQGHLIRTIRIPRASLMTTDATGNIYVVGAKNTLYRFDRDGNETGHYNNIQNGAIGWIDAGNPLKILVFYPQFGVVLLLDNMLSPIAALNLRQSGWLNVTACGMAGDGNIWIYDAQQAKLIEIDHQLNSLLESNDLRRITGTVPNPYDLQAANGKIYLSDSLQGIYTFDRYGSYLNTLAINAVQSFQVIRHQLIWENNDSLHQYNLKSFTEKAIRLPKGAINARISDNRLYILFPDKIAICDMVP